MQQEIEDKPEVPVMYDNLIDTLLAGVDEYKLEQEHHPELDEEHNEDVNYAYNKPEEGGNQYEEVGDQYNPKESRKSGISTALIMRPEKNDRRASRRLRRSPRHSQHFK